MFYIIDEMILEDFVKIVESGENINYTLVEHIGWVNIYSDIFLNFIFFFIQIATCNSFYFILNTLFIAISVDFGFFYTGNNNNDLW